MAYAITHFNNTIYGYCFQGFTVSVIYCFLNGEVRNAVGHHLTRWRTSNYFGGVGRYSSRYRDGSPKSRTESIRLCSAVTFESRCDNHVPNKDTCVNCLNSQTTSGSDQSDQHLKVANENVITNGTCRKSNIENTV